MHSNSSILVVVILTIISLLIAKAEESQQQRYFYVDNTSPSSQADGSQDHPFQQIEDCFYFIKNPSSEILKQVNIYLAPTETIYSFSQKAWTIQETDVEELLISQWENAGLCKNQQDCSLKATLNFENTVFAVTNLTSFTMSNLIIKAYDNNIDITNTKTILKNLSFPFPYRTKIITITDTPFVTISGISAYVSMNATLLSYIFRREHIRLADIVVENIVANIDANSDNRQIGTSTSPAFMAFLRSHPASPSITGGTIKIKNATICSYDGTKRINLKSFFSVRGFSTAILEDFRIQDMNFYTFTSGFLASFQYVTKLEINGLHFSGNKIRVNSSSPLFRLKNLDQVSINNFIFASNLINNPLDSVSFSFLDVDTIRAFESHNHTFADNVIKNGDVRFLKIRDNADDTTKLAKVSLKFSEIKILNNQNLLSAYQFTYFLLQGPYLSGTEFDSCIFTNNSLSGRVFVLQPLLDTTQMTQLKSPHSISIQNTVISDNQNTLDTSFLYFLPIENGLTPVDCLPLMDQYSVDFANLTFTNNVFCRGNSILWVYEASFFQVQGARVAIKDSLIANNFFGLYNFAKVTLKAASVMIVNTQIVNNTFNSSQLINTNYQKSPNTCQKADSDYTTVLYRFTYITSSNFSGISLNSSTLFTLNNGFSIFESNNFENITMSNSILLSTTFTAARLSFNSKGYIRDDTQEIVSSSQYLSINLFRDINKKCAVFQSNNSYFYYMSSNNFAQINASSSSLIVLNGFGFNKSLTLIQENKFQDINFAQDGPKQIFSIDSLTDLVLSRNSFKNVRGPVTIFYLPNSQRSDTLYVNRNKLLSSDIASFLLYGKNNLTNLNIANNEFSGNTFTQNCFTLNLRYAKGYWIFGNNNFTQNKFTPNSANKQAEVYALIRIFVTEACNFSNIVFSNNILDVISIIPYGQTNSIAETYLFSFETPQPVTIDNLILYNFTVSKMKASVLYISDSTQLILNNSRFETVIVQSDYGVMNLLSKSNIIANSFFKAVINREKFGLFFIDPPSGNYSAKLYNNSFSLIQNMGNIGSIFAAQSSKSSSNRRADNPELKNKFYLNFEMINCSCNDSGSGHLISLLNTTCQHCLLENNDFSGFSDLATVTNSFIQIEGSEGALKIKDTTFPSHRKMKGSVPFFRMTNSALRISLVNLTYDAQGRSFSLIQMNYGTFYLQDSVIKNVLIDSLPIIQVVATSVDALNGRLTNDTNVNILNTKISNVTKTPITISGMEHIVELLRYRYDPLAEGQNLAKPGRIGGVIFVANPTQLRIRDSSFEDIINTPVVFFSESVGFQYNPKFKSKIYFHNSTFRNLTFTMGPALTVIPDTYTPYINIDNCTFDTVQAEAGGVMSIYNSTLDVTDSYILNYNAKLIAPAILVGGDRKGISSFQRTKFNDAESHADRDVDSEAINFAIDFISDSKTTIKRAASSLATDQTIFFEGAIDHEFQAGFLKLDFQNVLQQTAPDFSNDEDVKITFSSSAAGSLSQNNFESTRKRINSTSALVPLKGVLLQGKAHDNVTLTFSYNASRILQNRTLVMTLRPCIAGEHDNGITCEPCKYPTYTLDPRQVCNHCPDHALCPDQNKIRPVTGYWNAHDGSSEIIDCPTDGSTRCNPAQGGNGRCKIGYDGPLCNACDYENGYTESGYFECKVCKNPLKELIISCVIASIDFIVQFISIYIIYVGIHQYTNEEASLLDVNKIERAYYLKSLLTYGQLMSILCLTSPQIYEAFGLTSQLGNPSSLIIFGAQCSMYALGFTHSEFLFYQTYAVIAVPILHLILVAFFALFFPIFNPSVSRKGLISGALVYLILKYQPGTVTALIQFISCRTTRGINYHYIASHPAWSCETDTYKSITKFFVAPSGIFWCILIPLVLLLKLRASRSNLFRESTKNLLGFFYVDTKQKFYYWGALVMILKLVLSLLVYGLEVHSETQIFTFLILLWIYQSLVRNKKPFITESCNNFEILLINLLLFNLVIIKCLLDSTKQPNLTKITILFSIIVNVSFFAYVIWKILKLTVRTNQELIAEKLLQESHLSESLISRNDSRFD